MLQLEITAKAARRARNEWSEEAYARELGDFQDQVRANPLVIDLLTYLGSMTTGQQPALAAAILEAARILAPFTGKFEPLHLAYAWAGEEFIDTGRPWEALAAYEGLRSRAFLDRASWLVLALEALFWCATGIIVGSVIPPQGDFEVRAPVV